MTYNVFGGTLNLYYPTNELCQSAESFIVKIQSDAAGLRSFGVFHIVVILCCVMC